MTKTEALLVLITHSFLLSENEKNILKQKIYTLSQSDIEKLGTLLALEKKAAIESNAQIQHNIALFIKNLRQHPPAI